MNARAREREREREIERDIYIYGSRDICCPHFAQKCHFFPNFIAKMAQKNLSIYGQIFCNFWILSKCTFNQFLEDIRM